MERIERNMHEFDATGKTVGRLATQISVLLQGKHKVTFIQNLDAGDSVRVKNIAKLRFSGKKIDQRMFYRHSGYLGGLKTIPMQRVMDVNPSEVLRRAVQQMLPKNRLRLARLKRLTIS